MMNFAKVRKSVKRFVHTVHVALICAMIAYSPVASSVQIVLGTAMKVRSQSDSGLDPVGVLAKGSVVEIPDLYKVVVNEKVDAAKTFDKWLHAADYSQADIKRRSANQYKDFYYPVRIVSMASGSSGRSLVGKTRFMALRVLERSRGGLRVKENARAYLGPANLVPIRGVSTPAPARRAPVARRAAPAARDAEAAPTADTVTPPAALNVQPPPAQPAADDIPTYTPPQDPPAPATTDTPAPEAVGSAEDCPTCRAQAQADLQDTQDTAAGVLPALDNSAANGLQGLPSTFPSTCRDGRFIKSDGTYGALGQKILSELRRHPETFLKNGAASRACPNFNNWTDAQGNPDEARRYHFWVYLITAMFAKESTCQVSPPIAQGPHGALCGLGQMPCSTDRNDANDSEFGWGNDCSGDMSTASPNIRCSVRRLDAAIDRGGGPYSQAFNYWSTLRGESRGLTKRLISQYEDCGAARVSAGGRGKKGKHVKHSRRSRTRTRRAK